MVSWKKSRTGEDVPLIDGVCLHSLVNPSQEAQKWAAHRALELLGDEVIFVLGCGGGFHLKALAKSMPGTEVVGLDLEVSLVEAAVKQGLRVWNVSAVEQILVRPELVELLLKPYSVVSYSPSFRSNPESYSRLEKFLLARNAEDFRRHAYLRPELRAWISSFRNDDELVSIHSLCRANLEPDSLVSNKGRLWYVLRELVL